MSLYTTDISDMIKMPNGVKRHKDRWIVKRLSGPLSGTMATFHSEAAARAECLYLSDAEDTCATIYPPVYEGDV